MKLAGGETPAIELFAHTHWDREWYWGKEHYRTMLLSVIKRLLAELESGQLSCFHLDGQSSVLDDALALAPELESILARYGQTGRLISGPWYVLADQMLVSGESLVRNLEFGLESARKIGEPMMIGYCPDTFGHSVDLPRIIKGFAIDCAIVWRGVPPLDGGPEFYWRSPDGSEVLAVLLADGYYQTLFLEQEAPYEERLAPWISSDNDESFFGKVKSALLGSCLMPLGGDHLGPPRNLKDKLSELIERLDVKLDLIDLREYCSRLSVAAEQYSEALPVVSRELRDNSGSIKHARAYMLPGVLSTRLYLKQANRELERRLLRIVEPLSVLMELCLPKSLGYPQRELRQASLLMLKNQPHDSICGCSIDDVHKEMSARNSSAHQILDILDRRVKEEILVAGDSLISANKEVDSSLSSLCISTTNTKNVSGFGFGNLDLCDPGAAVDSLFAFNLSSIPYTGVLPFRLAFDCREFRLDCLDSGKSASKQDSWQIDKVEKITEVFSAMMEVPEYKDIFVVTGSIYGVEVPPLGYKLVSLGRQRLAAAAGLAKINSVSADGKASNLAELEQSDIRSVSPDLNFSSWVHEPVEWDGLCLRNGFFELRIDESGALLVRCNDSFAEIALKSSFSRIGVRKELIKEFSLGLSFRNCGDGGDTYNFDPIPGDEAIFSRVVDVSVGARGPLLGSLKVLSEIDIPESLETERDNAISALHQDPSGEPSRFYRCSRLSKHYILTEITLKKGMPLVFFHTSFINRASDHRLEAVFDTGAPVSNSWSENHYCLYPRQHQLISKQSISTFPVKPGEEAALDRFPCQRFFVANDQIFLNNGLPEYGVEESRVSITLLRAVSMLSRGRLQSRGGGAGPHIVVPGANQSGEEISAEFAWAPLVMLSGFYEMESKSPGAISQSSDPARELPLASAADTNASPDYSYCLAPAAYHAADLFQALIFQAPFKNRNGEAVAGDHPGDSLAVGESLFYIDNPAIVLQALYKPCASGKTNKVRLRLLNVTHREESALLSFYRLSPCQVFVCRLDGQKPVELAPVDGRSNYEVSFTANQLITIDLIFE